MYVAALTVLILICCAAKLDGSTQYCTSGCLHQYEVSVHSLSFCIPSQCWAPFVIAIDSCTSGNNYFFHPGDFTLCWDYWKGSEPKWHIQQINDLHLRQDPPPLDLSFWSFLTFLHHGIEEVERHLLWKFYKKIRRKSWSNVPPKVVACIGFLYKVVHKIGCLRKFNRSRGI